VTAKNENLYQYIELEGFQKKLDRIGDPDLLETIQKTLSLNPMAGSLLKGGVRKARIKAPQRNEGKSGGYRVFFYFVDQKGVIYLIWLLDKREADNLSPQEAQLLQDLAKQIPK
jgi:hypothetical protein